MSAAARSGRAGSRAWRAVLALLVVIGLLLIWSAASVQLTAREQAGFAAATILLFLVCNRFPGRGMTLFLVVLSAAVSLRYIVWRVSETLVFDSFLQSLLGIALALAELYAVIVLALGYLQTSWPLERKPEPLPENSEKWPTVDVFIPTYNEDLSVVRATVLAALAIDWPREKLRVYILDDGRRTEFRNFAEAAGAGYIIRPDNAHAKAGNLNHALDRTDGEFVAVFDCDHVPTRAFLQMTMGWMLRDPSLAALQTPHHFYSPDPFQRNLRGGARVPPEGNLFYGLVQCGDDFWNASFFCGSCAVLRRAALEEIGGFAVETVTEDAHTALRLHRAGWNSAYLRLPLAAGLATERLILHIGQRIRWARGMLQILRLDNPLFGRGLSLAQRLCYLNAMAHFLFAVPRVIFLVAPLGFLLLGQNIIAASPLAIVAYALPHIFHAVGTNSRTQRNWRHSFWSEIYETVLALFLVRVTLATLLDPRRGRFNVTEKGGLLSNGYFDMRAVYPNLILAFVLLLGLLRGLYGMVFERTTTLGFQALALNSIWVTFSLLIVMAALAVGREARQARARHRVRARLAATLWLADGRVLRGETRDLSLGGASIAAAVPEGWPEGTREGTREAAAEGARIEVEVSAGGPPLLLPAAVRRWSEGTLQLAWKPASIAEESRIVSVVFGRADAWLGWSDFPDDRPLRSLRLVLVSIRGLFRPRGEPATAADVAAARLAATARVPAGTLAKQSLVVRPRGATAGRGIRAAAIALALLLPPAAQAQAPAAQAQVPAARAQAPANDAAPGAGGMTVRPIPVPGPAMPPLMPPLPPALAQPPAPVVAPVVAPVAAPVAASDAGIGASVHSVLYPLSALGAGPMTMRGTSPLQGVMFGIPSDEVVTAATLTLAGAMSPALIPAFSNVTVTLNEQYVGTIPVNPDHPQFGPLAMAVNPVFFQDGNRLNFRFTGRYTRDCNDPLSGLLWASVSDASTLRLTLARLPARRDLAELPRPFFQPQVRRTLTLPFILAGDADDHTLAAAAIAASWFGALADYRGARFPVAGAAPASGDAVLIATADTAPAGVALPPIDGPTIAEVPNPNDPFATILVVAGRSGAEAVAAASALALGSRTLSGAAMSVTAPAAPPRRPYDAPDWIPTNRKVAFGSLVDPASLQGSGYVPGTFQVPFRTAPDLYTWRDQGFSADIKFRAPPGPIIDVAASRLDVSINGNYLRSYSLAPREGPFGWIGRLIGLPAQGTLGGPTAIPPWLVFGQNDLQLYFDARPLARGSCAAIPGDLHMGVDPNSTIDLAGAYHFTTLPNLAFFAGAGFPFTRLADLSETAVVLPERPAEGELGAFLDLMGRIGSLTGYPVLRVAVVRPGELASVAGRELILLGTLADMSSAAGAPAASLLAASPYRIEGGRLSLLLPPPLGDARLGGARLGDEGAAMIGAQSPLAEHRSVVALLAGRPAGLTALVAAMGNPRLVADIQGSLALLDGGTISSYRAGPRYTVGHLPFWLWPDWLLRDEPAATLALMLAASALVAMLFYGMLRGRAARRLALPTRAASER